MLRGHQYGWRARSGWFIACGWTTATAASAIGFLALEELAAIPLVVFTCGLGIALIGMARLERSSLYEARELRRRLQRRRTQRQKLLNDSSHSAAIQAGDPVSTHRPSGELKKPRRGVWLEFDQQGLIQGASPEFCSWAGYGIEYLRGRHYSVLNAGRNWQPLVSDLALGTALKRTWIGEFTCAGSDRHPRVLKGELSFDGNAGSDGHFLLTGVDISEFRRRLENLQLERNHLEAIFHASPTAMLVVDADGRVRRANRLARRWFGPQDPVGRLLIRDVFSVTTIGGEAVDRSNHPFHRIRRTGEPLLDDRYRLGDPAAESRVVSVYASPIFDSSGDFCGCVFNLLDLTEQTSNREALNNYRERLELAFDGSGMGMWEWSVETGALTLCPRWLELLGYQAHELEPRIDTLTRLIHPDDLDGFMLALKDHFDRRTLVVQSELRLRHQDGTWKWAMLRGRVVDWTANGKPRRLIGVQADIHVARTREDLVQQQRELLGNVLELIPYAVYWKDAEGRFIGANTAFVNSIGVASPTELAGQTDEAFDWSLVDSSG
ncbi:MAG: PAS domain S-box protein, partial [Planctomycetales bacterium]|nr:PAS domain S-box protein [Planctomycetales bacterium]